MSFKTFKVSEAWINRKRNFMVICKPSISHMWWGDAGLLWVSLCSQWRKSREGPSVTLSPRLAFRTPVVDPVCRPITNLTHHCQPSSWTFCEYWLGLLFWSVSSIVQQQDPIPSFFSPSRDPTDILESFWMCSMNIGQICQRVILVKCNEQKKKCYLCIKTLCEHTYTGLWMS